MSRHETFCRVESSNQRRSSLNKYMTSSHDVPALINKLNPLGLCRNALTHSISWKYSNGSTNHDAQLSLWMNQEIKPLFCTNVHNKLLALLRRAYNQIVLLEYNIIEANGRIRLEKLTDND